VSVTRFALQLIREAPRFAVVGILNVTVSFIVFHLCFVEWPVASILFDRLGAPGDRLVDFLSESGIASVDASFATAAGYAAGVVNSFLLNSRWTFAGVDRSKRNFIRFFLLNVVGLIVTSGLMLYFVDVNRWSYLPTWLVVTGVVTILNFLGSKYWAFAPTVERADR
jgi:putative flippase GtrA